MDTELLTLGQVRCRMMLSPLLRSGGVRSI